MKLRRAVLASLICTPAWAQPPNDDAYRATKDELIAQLMGIGFPKAGINSMGIGGMVISFHEICGEHMYSRESTGNFLASLLEESGLPEEIFNKYTAQFAVIEMDMLRRNEAYAITACEKMKQP